MAPIELTSRIGSDGALVVKVPIGIADADREVRVRVEPVEPASRSPNTREKRHRFVERTYGSCAGAGLEEPEDLPIQQRDWAE